MFFTRACFKSTCLSSRVRELLLLVGVAAFLAACGGGSSSSSGPTGGSGSGSGAGGESSGGSGSGTGGGTSGGSSGGGCSYKDEVGASERGQANACGIQVSGAYGAADAKLQEIIRACQSGQKAAADAGYTAQYLRLVQFARDNSTALSCGGANTPVLPAPVGPNPSTQTYYNFCGKTTTTQYIAGCYGPVRRGVGGCGDNSFTYFSQLDSSKACEAEKTKWLNSKK